MTHDEILVMPAGREMNALVAEKVMGWHMVAEKNWTHWEDAEGHFVAGMMQAQEDIYSEDDEDLHILHWHPSESILWAWEVVEKLEKDAVIDGLFVSSKGCELYKDREQICAIDDNLPVAICRAALLTLETK